jgi:hypothetical protein
LDDLVGMPQQDAALYAVFKLPHVLAAGAGDAPKPVREHTPKTTMATAAERDAIVSKATAQRMAQGVRSTHLSFNIEKI